MATTPSNTTGVSVNFDRAMRPRPRLDRLDRGLERALGKAHELLSTVPHELVDRHTLEALVQAAEEGQYAVADAERYHALWMEAQDECRRLNDQALKGHPISAESEPPDRSVVIDCEGDAWQRDNRNGEGVHWECSGSDPEQTGKTWTGLLASYGPVRLVYTPEA